MLYSGLAVEVGGVKISSGLLPPFFYLFIFLFFIMFDCQVLSTYSFKAKNTGVTWYNADLVIPSLNVVLPLMSDKPFAVGSKGKVVLGYTKDRRALRASDFTPAS